MLLGNAGAITASSRKIEYDEAERRSAEPADDPVPAARAEPALHHRAGDQKGHDDEQDGAVAEAGVGVGRLEQPGEHRDGNGEDRRREDRQAR